MKFSLFFILILIFASFVFAQEKQFPNELEGFKFFGSGRLKNLKIGRSNGKDVEQIFGKKCLAEDKCEYDEKFLVTVDYLDLSDCMTTLKIRDRMMCPLEKYIGGIESITLTPRNTIRIESISTDIFGKRTGGGIFPKGGGESIYYESFADEFGLKYSFRKNDGTTHFPMPKTVGGELYSVNYALSEELETEIFSAPFRKSD